MNVFFRPIRRSISVPRYKKVHYDCCYRNFMKEVRIPEERVAVVIGSGGETKEDIQELTECELEINDNVVSIEGDALNEMTAARMVRAIGRGFAPEKATELVEKDVTFHLLDISEYEESKNGQERIKGRVIGRDGETRKHIEKEANIKLSIYGSKIGFIGKAQNIEVAMEAVKMLLQGSSHSTAYQYLEKNQDRIVY